MSWTTILAAVAFYVLGYWVGRAHAKEPTAWITCYRIGKTCQHKTTTKSPSGDYYYETFDN